MIRQAGPWLVRVSGGPQNATLILSFEDSRPNAILLGGQMNQGGWEGGSLVSNGEVGGGCGEDIPEATFQEQAEAESQSKKSKRKSK